MIQKAIAATVGRFVYPEQSGPMPSRPQYVRPTAARPAGPPVVGVFAIDRTTNGEVLMPPDAARAFAADILARADDADAAAAAAVQTEAAAVAPMGREVMRPDPDAKAMVFEGGKGWREETDAEFVAYLKGRSP